MAPIWQIFSAMRFHLTSAVMRRTNHLAIAATEVVKYQSRRVPAASVATVHTIKLPVLSFITPIPIPL